MSEQMQVLTFSVILKKVAYLESYVDFGSTSQQMMFKNLSVSFSP